MNKTAFFPVIPFVVFLLLFSFLNSFAEVVEENGTLRGFLAGECSTTAYDNWLSHTSEGIARPGYNDYGPLYLDPQNNDFGNYRIIPSNEQGDSTLSHWSNIFTSFINHDFTAVDQLLLDSLETFNYELVLLHDSEYLRDYYIIREKLDSTYVDSSLTPDDLSDDVVGSFRNSWGVFIINTEAELPNVMMQNVHPNDDFIANYFNLDLFLRVNAGIFCIHGAGREVEWTQEGDYSNSKSLSDPSRQDRSPIFELQKVFTDYYYDDYPYSAMVIQLHSFDKSNNHITPVILSAGYYWRRPHLPLFDRNYGGHDIIQNTPHPVFAENEYSVNGIALPEKPLDEYYSLNKDEDFEFNADNGDVITIICPSSHRGDPDNVEAHHLHHVSRYEEEQSINPFLHVELDEFPEIMSDNDVTWEDLLINRQPVTYRNYERIMGYYEPFMDSFAEWLEWYNNPVIEQNNNTIDELTLLRHDETGFGIEWTGTRDSYHLGYEILVDSVLNADTSPVVFNWNNDRRLISSLFTDCTFVAIPHQWGTQIGVRSVDLAGNRGALSNIIQLGVTSPERLPEEYLLMNCWPNPFNSTLSLKITSINNQGGTVKIYDLLGRLLYTIKLDEINGTERITWKPDNSIKSGTYFVILESGQSQQVVKKVTLLK